MEASVESEAAVSPLAVLPIGVGTVPASTVAARLTGEGVAGLISPPESPAQRRATQAQAEAGSRGGAAPHSLPFPKASATLSLVGWQTEVFMHSEGRGLRGMS